MKSSIILDELQDSTTAEDLSTVVATGSRVKTTLQDKSVIKRRELNAELRTLAERISADESIMSSARHVHTLISDYEYLKHENKKMVAAVCLFIGILNNS